MNKRAARKNLRARHIAIAVAAAFAPWSVYGQTPSPNQMPNVTVTNGVAFIHTPAGTFQQIDQATLRAIYEGSMTMGANAHLNLTHAAGRAGIGLFRDISGSLTQIFGRITSNGQVFISNQNGVLFGSTARVEVGGLFATSLSTNDADFMAGNRNLVWSNNGSAGAVTNHGTIIAPGGYAALAGPQVFNHGIIVANVGTVALAAGDRVTLDMIGDGLIGLSVDQAALNALATNTGTIQAESGKVLLTARSANALLDTVVNAGGVIRASSLIERNGEIILDGGTAGTTQITGTVDARDVTARAGTIFSGLGAAIIADNLTTDSIGSTSLTGSNQIDRFTGTTTGLGSSLTLVDSGALDVLGVTTNNGAVSLTADSLTNSGVITNSGGGSANIILSADAFNLAGGSVQAGNSAVSVRPRTGTNSFGIESAGATTISNADIASIQTGNFLIFGSSTGNIFTGNMTIGENARVEGNGRNLAFSRSLTPGAEMITVGSQGVATTGDIIIGAGGGGIRSNGGTVTGDEVVLRATTGIGTPTARVKTAANALALNNAGGSGVFVSELDNVTLRTITLNAGGLLTVGNTNSGSFSLISGGDVNVAGLVTSGGSMILDAGGNLRIDATAVDAVLVSNGGQTISAQSIDLIAQNGRRAGIDNNNGNQSVTARTGGMNLQAPTGSGVAQIVSTSNVVPGNQTIDAAGEVNILGGATATSTNSGIFKNGPGGLQTVRATGITLQGASTGTNAGSGIRSQGDQQINVSGDINLRGGNGGTTNNAFLSANPTNPAVAGRQTISARDINLSNGVGGIDTSATITAGKQEINATGNVTLTAQGALLGVAPGGPGVRIGAAGNTTTGTDLKLTVGGDLVLTGGATENTASIGSSGVGVPQQNKLVIDAGGSVVMNAGSASNSGVRIGSGSSGTAGGDISVKAGGAIAMNGTTRNAAIRTLDGVNLEAASISQSGNGSVQAGSLTTKSTAGNTSLTGANQVSTFNGTSSGDLTLNNSGPLTVTGVDATGNASLTNALGDVNLVGRWRSATASIAAGGAITQSGAGFIQAGSLTTNSVGLNLSGANLVDVFNGTSSIDLIFNNATALHVSGAQASGNANLTAAGTMTIGGAVVANGVTLTANGGGIEEVAGGSIVANTLNTVSTGDTTLNGANQVAAFSAISGGDVSLTNSGFLSVLGMNTAGDATINDFGNVTVAGPWSAGGTSSVTAGDILISGTMTSPDVVLNSGGSITQTVPGGIFANTLSTTSVGSTSLTGINAVANYDGASGAALTFNNNGALSITGLDAAGNASVTNFGNVTLTGAWHSASADIRANGFGSAILESGAGAIQTGSLTTFSEGTTSLTGANQVASFNGATSFGGGGITLNNDGPLAVTALSTGGNANLTNNGTVSVTGAWSALGQTNITTTGGDLAVTSFMSSGSMNLDVGGRLTLSANGPQGVQVIGQNGQTIRALGIEVTSRNNGFASLDTFNGNQNITVTGGSIDVQVLSGGGTASIANNAPGGTQTIRVVGGDHVNVNARGGTATIRAASTQEVSITGNGANAITVGSTGALGDSRLVGGTHQIVTAGAAGENGSISVVGPDASGRLAGIQTNPVANGTQTVSTAGTLRVEGGRAASQLGNFGTGVFHNGSGAQTVNAGRIELTGGAAGTNNNVFIASSGGGVPANAGAQNINVTGDIVLTGGAGGNASISGPATRLQKIQAANISMLTAATGGINTGAFISGGHQEIRASGNVTLTGRAAGGDLPGVRIGGGTGVATDLKLYVGGDLVLTAGAQNNGVSIGSSASGAALANDIYIEAGGNVVLNSGSASGAGARIGSSSLNGTAGGNIEIHAGGGIELNGAGGQPAAIRTLGNVTLDAASISETGNGFILADTLTTTTSGATSLAGPNDVARFNATSGGPLTFVDAGGLRVTGVSTTNDTITLTTDSLVNEGVITNGGGSSTANIVLNANQFNLAGGTVQGGNAAVVLRPRTGTNSFGIEAAGQTTVTNADIASIQTNDFVVFGSGIGTTFTGNMTIGENARVEGGGKHLAFFRSSAPGGTTTIGSQGVATTGNVIVSAGGGAIVSNGGTVTGDQVQLRASQGIGSTLARVRTEASRLAVNNTGSQGAFVSELSAVTLGNVNLTVGGNVNNVGNTIGGGGSYELIAGGSITLSDLLQAGNVALTTPGSIIEVGAGAIVANDLRTSSGQSTILGGANQVSAFSASAGGDVVLANTGPLAITSLFASNADVDNQGAVTVAAWGTTGSTSVTTTGPGADLTVLGALTSGGPMDLDIEGTLRVAAGGTQNAILQSSGGQDITARAVEVSARDGRLAQIVNFAGDQTVTATAGGVDVQASGPGSNASIQNNGLHQTVNAAGGVRMLSQAGGVGQIGNAGSGDQSINVSSGGLSMAAEGGLAAIANTSPLGGNQRISVAGGSGIDLRSTGGGVSLGQAAAGRSQTILVTDADHISLNGVSGSAAITANGGTQTISITGSGANAITLGSAGATGPSQIAGGSTQHVTAGAGGQSGSIAIIGTAVNGPGASIATRTGDGTQTVTTSGLLSVTGGTAPSQIGQAGVFHSGSGAQTVNAERIELRGGASGNNNGALIVSNSGAQNVNVSGDLIIAGGAGGNAGITGPAARLQTIRAANIHMTNSAAGGNNSVGFILGGHQNIGVTGDLTMTARASGGNLPGVRIGGLSGSAATATDLLLTVGGDLILTGGTVAGNGVGIGSTAAPGPAFDNNITITTGGDVILNSGVAGSGVRIGSSASTGAAAGDIRITAGGDIRLNGVEENAAIRTLGNVTLDAASITEGAKGLIEAAALTTRTDGDTLLGGANRVSSFTAASDHGNVLLNNTSALLTLGSMDLPGNLAVVQAGDVAVGSATASGSTLIAAAGDISMSATGQILVRGSDTTAGAGAAVLAGGDLSFSAGDVTLLAGDAALTPVVVRGADGVEMTVGNELRVTGGRGLLSPTLLTSGRDIDLTIGRAVRVDAGTGLLSLARVQLESRGGVIRLAFPELSHGGYFVNGIEGRTHQGQSGFYSLLKPVKVGKTLLLDYGD